jgi:phosphatidylglycerophosphate synthase
MRTDSIRRLRVVCQAEKLRKRDDLTRKHRALSIYATWLLIRTPVTADQVTALSIATGLIAAVLLALPGLAMGLAGCALLYVSFLLDQVDGEVARYRRQTSLRGVYLDEIRHMVVYATPVFALGFDVARQQLSPWPLAVSFVAGLSLLLARIEERLPALMAGERGTKLAAGPAPEARSDPVEERRTFPEARPSRLKRAARHAIAGVNALYETVAHQVLILGWFLVAVVLDRGLGATWAEGAFLAALALTAGVALMTSVRARLVPGAVEADVAARLRRR